MLFIYCAYLSLFVVYTSGAASSTRLRLACTKCLSSKLLVVLLPTGRASSTEAFPLYEIQQCNCGILEHLLYLPAYLHLPSRSQDARQQGVWSHFRIKVAGAKHNVIEIKRTLHLHAAMF